MLVSFEDKVAIVTGGASGIGAALVRILADSGAQVVIADLDADKGRALEDELGGAARSYGADVTDPAAVENLVETAIAAFGRIDLLFNNAGKGIMGQVPQIEPGDWHRIIDANLSSAFLMARAVIPHMRGIGGGAIVNTCSVSGIAGDYAMAAYNAAKGGLVNLTRAMALDHAAEGIRVNGVCPGLIADTSMTERLHEGPGGLDVWNRRIPMRRTGRAVEVARLMAFLASDLASYMTGSIVTVDGGLTAHTGFPTSQDFADAS